MSVYLKIAAIWLLIGIGMIWPAIYREIKLQQHQKKVWLDSRLDIRTDPHWVTYVAWATLIILWPWMFWGVVSAIWKQYRDVKKASKNSR